MHKYQHFDDEMRLHLLRMDAEHYGSLDADWQQIYDSQFPRVLAYFRCRVSDGVTAEDLTAETFARAWRSRERFDEQRASFGTWLFSIARHVLIDSYRQQRVTLEYREMHDAPAPSEDMLDVERDAGRLAHLLEHLPERERSLIGMKYGAGLTNRRIADCTGLSESNVGTILHRAMHMLREAWQHDAEIVAE